MTDEEKVELLKLITDLCREIRGVCGEEEIWYQANRLWWAIDELETKGEDND